MKKPDDVFRQLAALYEMNREVKGYHFADGREPVAKVDPGERPPILPGSSKERTRKPS